MKTWLYGVVTVLTLGLLALGLILFSLTAALVAHFGMGPQ